MPVKEILLLGHPKLYKISELVQKYEIARLRDLADDLSELLQHEVDHLDGILAIQRAIDHKSFAWR